MPATPNNASPAGPPTQAAAVARLTSLLQEPTHPNRLRTWLSGQTPPPTPLLTPAEPEEPTPAEPAQPAPYYVGYTATLSQQEMAAHKTRLIKAAQAAGIALIWIEQNIWGERTTTTLYKPSALPSSDSPPSSSS